MKKPNLLFVEDTEAIRIMTLKALAPYFNIVEAINGQEASNIIQLNTKFDCLLTDFELGDMDGLDIALEFRKWNVDPPIVLTTGSPLTNSRIQTLLKMPNTNLVEKPFNIEILKNLLFKLTLIDLAP